MGCFHPVSHSRNVEATSVIMQTRQIALQSPECELTEAIWVIVCSSGQHEVTSVTDSVITDRKNMADCMLLSEEANDALSER